ncbi:aspartate/glutamate racemase family protein [Brevundimonas sp.]|uniref:aspartate/glutamate racemase family protein n=1 Tax=Brevundimonas sp. TaxID=1871086 RepID=UPI002ABBE78D|nr:amino acid racemase [Brevundimonas sp.]MDZ4364031.1 amino acid racemase [Brevundimonas sp.]
MPRILGILGGMGPAATVAFLDRLVTLTPAEHDEDHIRVLMDMNPQVPNRHRNPPGAAEALGRMATSLRDMGAQVLAMPCNTAHAHASAIRAAGIPFIDMIERTAAAAVQTGAQRIGILATPGGQDLYVAELERQGRAAVVLNTGDRRAFLDTVFAVKRGDVDAGQRMEMRRLAAALVSQGAQVVIAGCTEVPLLLASEDVTVPLVDSAEVLAMACIAACVSTSSHDKCPADSVI